MKFLLPFWLRKKEEDPNAIRYADLYERVMAAAVDATLLFLLFQNIFYAMTRRLYQHANMEQIELSQNAPDMATALYHFWQSGMVHLWLINCLVQAVVMGVLYVGCQVVYRTTPGKWLLGLSIRMADTLEEPPHWRYLLRYVALIIGAPLFMVMSFNRRHRGVHDMIAGTAVIHLRPKGWYWEQTKAQFRRLRGRKNNLPPVE
jgi:uncharacterized RDD family membrane protein YckC